MNGCGCEEGGSLGAATVPGNALQNITSEFNSNLAGSTLCKKCFSFWLIVLVVVVVGTIFWKR